MEPEKRQNKKIVSNIKHKICSQLSFTPLIYVLFKVVRKWSFVLHIVTLHNVVAPFYLGCFFNTLYMCFARWMIFCLLVL